MRRLHEVDPHPENQDVVELYHHKRFHYHLQTVSPHDVTLDCVPSFSLRRVVFIVRDMFDVTIRFGAAKRVNELPDDREERKKATFFEVSGVQITSFP